ncbi:hypothetical protein H0H92_002567 [Tricholoma furcatifolium]|nr:hypothetical protein H0H92_002567 [Tricholoma furcatifolium]
MDKEIAEFETLVQKAHQTFTNSTLITISGHIFLLQSMLEEIRKAHKVQEETIAAERAYSDALNRELNPHIISHPTYDMQGKLPCEPGSRTMVLKEIFDWIHDHSGDSQNFLWLTGDPGCGKSAVTANVSQVAKDRRFLWAQYFINRNEEQTTNPNVYFPTIARQLSDNSTKVERHVHDTVMEARSLLDHISPDQAAHLFISAMSKASKSTPNAPVLVVIDALDETDKARLYDTATIFSNIFDKLSAYPNAKILISSRTEHDVYKPFTSTLTNKHVRRLHLDTRDPSSLADVGRFMRDRLDKIARKHDLDRTMWPGREREARLIDQAAGLYIWATTVIKFLDERLSKQGRENLYGIIDQLKLPDKADIHVLYLRILQVTYDSSDMDETTKWDLEKCRRIMGAIAVARVQLSVSQLADLLDLRYAPDTDPVDIRNFVQLLRTVLVSGTDDITGETMIQLHKSFFEFITTCSENRFRVNLEAATAEMALCCLQHLAKSYIIVTNTQFAVRDSDVASLPFSTRYALRFCLSHIPRRPRSDGDMLGVVLANSAKLLPQLNALIPKSVHSLPLSISLQDDPRLVTTSIHTHSLVWNVDNGSSKTPISVSLASGQLFPLRDGRFFGHRIYTKPDFWSLDAQTFRPVKKFHPECVEGLDVTMISFCPDKSIFALADNHSMESDSLTISIWDISTVKRIATFERPKLSGHDEYFLLANDGIHMVFAHVTGFEIWNIRTKLLERKTAAMDLNLDPARVTLSPDGAHILSVDRSNYTLRLWDFYTCQPFGEPFRGHTDSVVSTAFSPKSNYIVSSSNDKTVRLWDIHTQRQVGKPWPGDRRVGSVSFSPDGSYVLKVTLPNYQLFDVPGGQCIANIPIEFRLVRLISRWFRREALDRTPELSSIFYPDGQQAIVSPMDPGRECCILFNISPYTFHIKNTFVLKWSAVSTPTGNLVVYSAFDNTLYLSRLDLIRFGGCPLPRDNPNTPVFSIAFSPDEQYISAACEDGMIFLWTAEDNKLIASYQHDLALGPSTLSFVQDGSAIIVKTSTVKYLLIPSGHHLIPSHNIASIQEVSSMVQDSTSSVPHIYNDPPNRRLETVRWFPFAPSVSGDVLWAYIDNYIIRAGKDGKFLIIPVAEEHTPH